MSNLTSYSDVEMCLTCPTTKNLMSLYTADILNKLQLFINIEQPHLTELPKFICQSCENALNSAYAFKEQCEERTTELLNIIKQNKLKFLTDENCEPQIFISMEKNEDLNLDDEFISITNVDIKEELFELIEAEVKIEEITAQKTTKLIKKSDNLYKCDLCTKVFNKPSLRKKHKINDHKETPNPDLKYSCTFCDERFRYKAEFYVHRKSHKTCPECNKVFKTDQHMLQHLQRNHTNKPDAESCHLCGKEISKANMKRHIRSFHNKELLHFCEICNRGFYEKALLKIHMTTHSDIRPFKCEICERTFKSQKNLDVHKNVHSETTEISCKYCDKVFCSIRDYDVHLQQHEVHKESFQCTVCNRKFALESHLTLHAKIHLKPFKICQICGKSLGGLTSFNYHMRIHTNERPFKCSVCPKQYKHLNQLTIHRRVHSGERPYKCKLCNMSFRQIPHLISHQNVHSTEKKFSCDICGVCVGYKNNLRIHIRNVHQNERNYQCKHCTESYFSNNMLKKHLQQKHKDLIDL